MEEREEGMTLGEILSLMFKKKLILLIITLVVAVIGIVGILAIYNPMKRNLYTDFYYEKTVLTQNKYTNGESFRMADIISKKNIEEVIASNSDYSVLDAEEVYKNASIETVQEVDEEKNVKTYYKVSILAKKLKNDTLGSKFVQDLVNWPVKKDIEYINDLDLKKELNKYDEAKTYADAFSYLASAYKTIQDEYNSLITTYGDVLYKDKSNESKILSSRLLDVDVYYKNQDLNTLLSNNTGLIVDYGLVLDYDFSRQSIQNQLNEINDNLELTQNQIDAINEEYETITKMIGQQAADKTVYDPGASNVIAKQATLAEQKVNLVKQKEKVELRLENETSTNIYVGIGGIKSENQYNALDDKTGYVAHNLAAEKAAIKTKLDATKKYLSEQIDIVKQVKLDLNQNSTFVYYQSNAITRSNGGLNSILAVVLSLLIGLVVGCIVSFALSYGAFKAKKEEELNRKEEERIKKEITYRKMFKENGVDVNQDNK